jgi:hypothetical protein
VFRIGEAIEEISPDATWLSDRAIQPGVAYEVDAASGHLHPALRQPVNEMTSRAAKPDY